MYFTKCEQLITTKEKETKKMGNSFYLFDLRHRKGVVIVKSDEILIDVGIFRSKNTEISKFCAYVPGINDRC